jgi:hypothetical protein
MLLIIRNSSFLSASSFDIPHHDFHSNFLKGELIVNHPEQFESSRVGYVIATEFNARVFLGEFGIRLRQFTIEKKRHVGVKSLL